MAAKKEKNQWFGFYAGRDRDISSEAICAQRIRKRHELVSNQAI